MFRGPRGCMFITAGNIYRSDDGVGPYIGEMLAPHAEGLTMFKIVNAGVSPEDHIDTIVGLSPGFVVFIDAAQFNGKPGEMILLDEDAGLPDYSLSTHTLPLNLMAALIKSECPAAFFYIGIQSASLEFGEELSLSVQKAADLLINEIVQRIENKDDIYA